MPQRPGSHRRAPASPRGRILAIEQLESRSMLSLTHLYTFNDGTVNDSVGAAHGALVGGAAIAGGKLNLFNAGTSGAANVQYASLPSGVLPATGSATVVAWYSAQDLANFARVFDFGDQTMGTGTAYLYFTPQTSANSSRLGLKAAAQSEVQATAPTTDNAVQHMVAAVIDASADLLRVYIDGAQVTATPLGGADVGDVGQAVAWLGRSLFNVDAGFTGWIDELRIYDEALAPATVGVLAAEGPTDATLTLRQMEYLNRGVVAVHSTTTHAYIGWRLLGTDPDSIAFNLYRSAGGGAPVKLNAAPLVQTTDFVDTTANFAVANAYFVRPIVAGIELAASESFTLAANAPVRQYINVPLQRPPGATVQMPPGVAGDPGSHDYTYNANDASLGDLDGDGQYEIILKWDPFNPADVDPEDEPRMGEGSSQDNSFSGFTGLVLVDAYKLDGTLLWRINLGRNIRAGAHYTQFQVYDLDGDGKAEVAMRTAPGTIDGQGNPVLMGSDQVTADYRNSSGYIITGPEYLTVFNGATGAAMATIPFTPSRGSVSQWGDNYGNRVDRFLAGVAYLDGVRPSLIMSRGYYGPQSGGQARNEIAAYDFRDGQLTLRWLFRAGQNINGNINSNYIGQGNHNLSIADVDGDGKDEIVYGSALIDDDGSPEYSTGRGHGDALHVSDMDPSRPGLEIFSPHETPSAYGTAGGDYRDARTGQLLTGIPSTNDVGRGAAFDIDPRYVGYEFWATTNVGTRMVYSSQGNALYSTSGGSGSSDDINYNFGVWWDADPLRELLDGTQISKWRYDLATPGKQSLLSMSGTTSVNGTKATPSLTADVFGDWREEIIMPTTDSSALRIYTTTISATNRMYTLMHDSQYREAVAWQNSAYNQPPHPSFFLGAGMAPPPTPKIYLAAATPPLAGDFDLDRDVDAADLAIWRHTFGTTAPDVLPGDADGDARAAGSDFLAWQRGFGAPQPSELAAADSSLAAALVETTHDAALSALAAESLRTLLTSQVSSTPHATRQVERTSSPSHFEPHVTSGTQPHDSPPITARRAAALPRAAAGADGARCSAPPTSASTASDALAAPLKSSLAR